MSAPHDPPNRIIVFAVCMCQPCSHVLASYEGSLCALTNPAAGRAGPRGAHARGPGARGCGYGQARRGGRPQRAPGRPLHSGAQPWGGTCCVTLAAAWVLLCMFGVWAAHAGLCTEAHQPQGRGSMLPFKPGRCSKMQGVVKDVQRPKRFD